MTPDEKGRPAFVDYVPGTAANAVPERMLIIPGPRPLILVASEEGAGGGPLTVYEIRRR